MHFPLHNPGDNAEELSDRCQSQREGAGEQKPLRSAVPCSLPPCWPWAAGLQTSALSFAASVRGVPQALLREAFAFPLHSPVTGLLRAFAPWTEGCHGLSSAELTHGKDH